MTESHEGPRDLEITPVLELVTFALQELKTESSQNEGVFGVINRVRMSAAIKDVQKGKMDKARRFLRSVANRYSDMGILDYQLSHGLFSADPTTLPIYKKVKFYETVASLLGLEKLKADVARGTVKLREKRWEERAVEALLGGNDSKPSVGQPERLLQQARDLKTEIWG